MASDPVQLQSMTSLQDHGPSLTPAEAAALHDRAERVVWLVLPAPGGNGVIARAHTEAHDGGLLLPGHLAADDLADLGAMLPLGLRLDETRSAGSPPGCLGWWWDDGVQTQAL